MPDVTASYGTLIDFIAFFFSVFHLLLTTIHVLIVVSTPNIHRLCVKLMYTFRYVNMSKVTAGYGRFSD